MTSVLLGQVLALNESTGSGHASRSGPRNSMARGQQRLMHLVVMRKHYGRIPDYRKSSMNPTLPAQRYATVKSSGF